MIEEFLQKYQDSLIFKERELKNSLSEVEIEIRRQQKYLDMISSEQEEPFSAFSPHATDQKKTLELDEQFQKMDSLQLQRTAIDQDLMNVVSEINEVERALKEVDEQNKKIRDLNAAAKENTMTAIESLPDHSKEIIPPSITKDNMSVMRAHDYIRDIRIAASFLPQDPMRSKQILNSIIEKIEQTTS